MIRKTNIYIYPNLQKDNAYKCTLDIIDILEEMNYSIYIDPSYLSFFKDSDKIIFKSFDEIMELIEYIIAVGGDGTILQCSKLLLDTDIKLVGVNTGRLGFMSSIEHNELEIIKKLKTKEYKISNRMMLNGLVNSKELNALNDIVIYESRSKMCEFLVKSDSIIVGKYRANGIIFSTPTGSTAYALSAGGPVINPELRCIEMSLICPHSLFARPLIFSDSSIIEISFKKRDNEEIIINADGENEIELSDKSKVIIKKSDYSINIVDFKDSTFFNTLNKKLMQPLK